MNEGWSLCVCCVCGVRGPLEKSLLGTYILQISTPAARHTLRFSIRKSLATGSVSNLSRLRHGIYCKFTIGKINSNRLHFQKFAPAARRYQKHFRACGAQIPKKIQISKKKFAPAVHTYQKKIRTQTSNSGIPPGQTPEIKCNMQHATWQIFGDIITCNLHVARSYRFL